MFLDMEIANRMAGLSYCVHFIDTPVGLMCAGVSDAGLHFLHFADKAGDAPGNQTAMSANAATCVEDVRRQLDAYFAGSLRRFNLPLVWHGTAFQQTVWRSLLDVPYGRTRSYAEQAALLGCPKAVRAVANVNRLNPWAIIVPCHRIIGSDGSLTGYAGGLERKRFLLDLEREHAGKGGM